MAVEDDVDALYAAGPDEFVAGRQALVKRLRAEGDRERAAEVAGLRRPTAAAWAVNQLARGHGDDLAALVALGDDLRRSHERLLAGGRDDDAVALGRRRREAIADLVDRAAAILAESGRAADAHRDAVSATLDAASLDPDVAGEVVAGRLSKELDPPSGFGDYDWSAPAPAPPATARPAPAPAKSAKSSPPPKAKPAPAADPEAERAAERQARRREEARQRASSARSAATRARDLAEQARAAAERADAERERLEEEVIRARKTAVDSRRAARELRDAAHEAERQATALEASLPDPSP